jgi:cell fate (sporulation/competence/biofilm development) regulator YlbF (YheA/YmcA/DUF963 family)
MVSTDGAGDPTNDWAWDYENHVLLFNHQDDLLARMVLDITNYFLIESEHLDTAKQLDNALQHYSWSKLMFERYEKMQEKPNLMKDNIKKNDECISDIEQRLKGQNNGESDHE